MEYLKLKESKIDKIRQIFSPVIGETLRCIEIADLYIDDVGAWERWDDLPIRLFFESNSISVSWTRFEDLRITADITNPSWFSDDLKVRWHKNDLLEGQPFLDQQLQRVLLGCGDFSICDQEIEIWPRILLEFRNGWFEIYNGLDQNAYAMHQAQPLGEFCVCA